MCNLNYFHVLNSRLELCKIMYNLLSVLYIVLLVLSMQCRLY